MNGQVSKKDECTQSLVSRPIMVKALGTKLWK